MRILLQITLPLAVAFNLCLSWQCGAEPVQSPEQTWWKGNLHTHSLWSDGDDYPEMITAWYKENGYHFLALSDHNILLSGERWIHATNNRGGQRALQKYLDRFGPEWVETRSHNGAPQVRLKPLNEFRALFEEPGRFLLIQAEEITDHHANLPVHVNATNLRDYIPPAGGSSVFDVMQNNVNAVLEQRLKTGQIMIPHVAHPNFGYAITAEELMRVQGERFFEVYNGHPAVRNEGDTNHVSVERMWDIMLAWRMTRDNPEPLFALAVDDTHNYHDFGSDKSNGGRGWVVVQAAFLTPEHIIQAMEAGRFYASTGVALRQIRREADNISIAIEPAAGVTYKTQFIGTRKNVTMASEPVLDDKGEVIRTTRRYSSDIGVVLAEVEGPNPSYTFQGDEIYVRAKINSSRIKDNPYMAGEFEVAWTQPLQP
jgi:hypothetical protein